MNKTVFVIAGNIGEFEYFIRELLLKEKSINGDVSFFRYNNGSYKIGDVMYRNLTQLNQIRGIKNIEVITYGTWEDSESKVDLLADIRIGQYEKISWY